MVNHVYFPRKIPYFENLRTAYEAINIFANTTFVGVLNKNIGAQFQIRELISLHITCRAADREADGRT